MALFVPDTGVASLDLFEDLARQVVQQYTDAENEVLAQMQHRIDRQLTAPGPQERLERQLAQLTALRSDAQRVLARIDDDLALDVMAVAVREGSAAAGARLGLIRHLPTPGPITSTASSATVQVALDLRSRLDDVKGRILRYEQDQYQSLIAGHLPGVLLGTTSSLDAQRSAVAEWLARGIPGFVDKAGRNWSVGGYVEMATRTGLSRAYLEAGLHRQQQVGLNLVTIIVGASACKSCAQWIGKILSLDGTTGTVSLPNALDGTPTTVHIDGTLAGARGTGHLFGPNCRCHAVAYQPGLAIPFAATTYDPAKEAARDRQRAFERRLRQQKRALQLSPSESDQRALRIRIRDTEGQLRKHLDRHPELTRKRNREQTSFQYGPPQPRPPAAPPAPTPVPPAPSAPPAPGALREQIATMSPMEAATAAQARHGIPFLGFERHNPAAVRSAISAVSEMLDRFPNVRLQYVQIKAGGSSRRMAVTKTPTRPDVHGRDVLLTPFMEISPSTLVPSKISDTIRASNQVGHFHDVPTDPDQAIRYVVVHEFGHVLDSNTQRMLRAAYARQLDLAIPKPIGSQASRDWLAANVSGYGRQSPGEGVAEAFADSITHGEHALPFSRQVMPVLLKIIEEEI